MLKKTQWMMIWMMAAPLCLMLTSAHAADFPEITAKELKSVMDSGDQMLLINPLSDIEFSAEHIPGSVNIPLQHILITDKLPKDKSQLIITYCLGRKCIVSIDAAELAASRGYTNILVFRDGIPGWKKAGFKTISKSSYETIAIPVLEPSELNRKIDDFVIVDIRPESTYKKGYIPESRAMPMTYLSMLSVELPKESKILVVDYSGRRCKMAAKWLIDNGWADVSILKNGLIGYSEAGFVLEQ